MLKKTILKSSQVLVFSDAHFKTPYPISPGRWLFGQIDKQHSFESKVLRKYHSIIVKPLTIRSPQEDTIPQLYSSPWWKILYQPETFTKILSMVLPLLIPTPYSSSPILISHASRHKSVLQNLQKPQVQTQYFLYLSVSLSCL